MPFVAVGVEHTTAPLSVRERIALDEEGAARANRDLVAGPVIDEVAALSTCNRTELYLFSDRPDDAAAEAAAYLGAIGPSASAHLQRWDEMEAIEHLFRVASGLESQILGEPQVLSQVREAMEIAQRAESIGPNLHALFRAAVSCARQARAGTALGRIGPSLGSQAVTVTREALGTLQDRSLLLIGGGEIARLVAESFRGQGLKALFVANRTPATATELARRYGGRPVTLQDVPKILSQVDAAISATSARHYVLPVEDVPVEALAGRERPLQIFDLAIPRDIDPAVGSLSCVELHDLDSLLPEGVQEQWSADVRTMEATIGAEIAEFMAWYLTRRVVPVISNLRSHVESVAEKELQRVAPQLEGLTDRERRAVESLTQRLIDKMFHHLVMRLRLAAQTDPKLVEAAEFFFLHGEGSLFPHAQETETEAPEVTT